MLHPAEPGLGMPVTSFEVQDLNKSDEYKPPCQALAPTVSCKHHNGNMYAQNTKGTLQNLHFKQRFFFEKAHYEKGRGEGPVGRGEL